MALGHFADIVENNEREGYFTVGLLATCPSMPSAIGFATIPSTDEGGLSLAAVNRMIAGAIRGVKARESKR